MLAPGYGLPAIRFQRPNGVWQSFTAKIYDITEEAIDIAAKSWADPSIRRQFPHAEVWDGFDSMKWQDGVTL